MKPHSLIIGGTRGIGRELVRLFYEAGHTVSVVGRGPPGAEDQGLAHLHHQFGSQIHGPWLGKPGLAKKNVFNNTGLSIYSQLVEVGVSCTHETSTVQSA